MGRLGNIDVLSDFVKTARTNLEKKKILVLAIVDERNESNRRLTMAISSYNMTSSVGGWRSSFGGLRAGFGSGVRK